MEFKFNVNDIFKAEVAVIRNNLLPDGFSGDYRARAECSTKITTILADMGEASAKAQGLPKAITSGDKLKNSEHIVYLLISPEDYDGKGSVIGLLKVGYKKLFVFDQYGYQHEVDPLCILDFYVHESRQRMGCGKLLFEFMLQEQNILPQNLAIDKPSEKFLAFLYKHYHLENAVPQMNNFVIFAGFFDYGEGDKEKINNNNTIKRGGGPHCAYYKTTNRNSMHELYAGGSNGRHAAPKAESTMGLILKDSCPALGSLSDGSRGAMRNSWAGEGSPAMTPEAEVEVRCPAADFLAARSPAPVVMGEKYRHSRLW